MIAVLADQSSSQSNPKSFGSSLGLVITRNVGDSLAIVDRVTGESIVVSVGDVRGGRARIGIDAADRYEVIRAELTREVQGLYDAIRNGSPVTQEMLKGYDLMREAKR
jgi:sRNA-binding carbon storage regulator CsrA